MCMPAATSGVQSAPACTRTYARANETHTSQKRAGLSFLVAAVEFVLDDHKLFCPTHEETSRRMGVAELACDRTRTLIANMIPSVISFTTKNAESRASNRNEINEHKT